MRGFDCSFMESKIEMDENEDEIIKKVQRRSSIGLDISCPDLFDVHEPCRYLLHVAKYLIQCKRSIDFIHGKSENTNPFILKNIENGQFKEIYAECVNSEQCAEKMQNKEVSETQKQLILDLA